MKYKTERTLVIIKPDGVQRGLIGEVIGRIERVGFKLVGLKFKRATTEEVRAHYTIDPEWILKTGEKALNAKQKTGENIEGIDALMFGEGILKKLEAYITASPVAILVFEGAHVVEVVRKLVGSTEPKTSDVGTIRGDYVHDSYEISNFENRSVRNVVHASSSIEDAQKEISTWFEDSEVIDYRLVAQEMMYDVNMDGENE